jgi:hypothetical protein
MVYPNSITQFTISLASSVSLLYINISIVSHKKSFIMQLVDLAIGSVEIIIPCACIVETDSTVSGQF